MKKFHHHIIHIGKHTIRWSVFWTSWALFFLLVLLIAAAIWLGTGERSIPDITAYMKTQIAHPAEGVAGTMDDAVFTLGSWRHPVAVELHNVWLTSEEPAFELALPSVRLNLSGRALLRGEIQPAEIVIADARLRMSMPASTDMARLEQAPPEQRGAMALAAGMRRVAEGLGDIAEREADSVLGSLKSLTLENMQFSLIDAPGAEEREELLSVSGLSGMAEWREDGFAVTGDLLIPREAGEVAVDFGLMRENATGRLTYTLDTGWLELAMLPPLLPEDWRGIGLTGTAGLQLKGLWQPQAAEGYIEAAVKARDVVVDMPEQIDGPITLDTLSCNANLTFPAAVKMESCDAVLEGKAKLHAEGAAVWGAELQGHPERLILDAKLTDFDASMLRRYWPVHAVAGAREWVIENITKGTVPSATLEVWIDPEDWEQERLPADVLKGHIEASGLKISYLSPLPPIEEANGTLDIDLDGIRGHMVTGRMMENTLISDGGIAIGLREAEDATTFVIEGKAITTLPEMARLLSQPPVSVPDALNLKEEAVSGTAEGLLSLAFVLDHGPPDEPGFVRPESLAYEVKASLGDAAAEDFAGEFDISEAAIDLTVSEKAISAEGKGQLFGSPATIAYTGEQKKDDWAHHYEVDTALSIYQLHHFDAPPLEEYATGKVGVKAIVDRSETGQTIKLDADLTDTGIALPRVGFAKPVGQEGRLTLDLARTGISTDVEHLLYVSGEQRIEGHFRQATKDGPWQAIELATARFGKNDASASLRFVDGGYSGQIKAASLDLSPWLDYEEPTAATGKKEEKGGFDYGLNVTADIDRLILGEGGEAGPIKGSVLCSAKRCYRMDIAGKLGEQDDFSIRIIPGEQGRQLEAASSDAGKFLEWLDITDRIRGGRLEISGVFTEQGESDRLDGNAYIHDFRLLKTPVLARILNVASLTGMLELLQGNGISFTKLSLPFNWADDRLGFKTARAYGASMGITAEGLIDFEAQQVAVNGNVIPSYTLNSFVNKIPLLGKLAGGRGEGIFATKYTVKGSLAEPDVSVNPLSLLTPGFLRNVFDAFDVPPEKRIEIEKEQQAVEEETNGAAATVEAAPVESMEVAPLPPPEPAP